MKFNTIFLAALGSASSGTASALPEILDSSVVTSGPATAGEATKCQIGFTFCGWELKGLGKYCHALTSRLLDYSGMNNLTLYQCTGGPLTELCNQPACGQTGGRHLGCPSRRGALV